LHDGRCALGGLAGDGEVALGAAAVLSSLQSAATEPRPHRIEVAMRSEPSKQLQAGRIVAFRPRTAGAPHNRVPSIQSDSSPVADLRQYQRAREEEDYRHRMVVNVLALAFCVLLAIAGIWLVNEIAEMKRVQDCVLSGRGAARHCRSRRIEGPERSLLRAARAPPRSKTKRGRRTAPAR